MPHCIIIELKKEDSGYGSRSFSQSLSLSSVSVAPVTDSQLQSVDLKDHSEIFDQQSQNLVSSNLQSSSTQDSQSTVNTNNIQVLAGANQSQREHQSSQVQTEAITGNHTDGTDQVCMATVKLRG